jgi:uncharacterized membrane protein HdeD (DUF308 family)
MSSIQQPAGSGIRATLEKAMHEHWGLFLAEGIVLIVLGLAAIVIPPLAGLAATIFLGWLFVVAGIVGLVATFRAQQAPGFAWALLSAILALIAGGILLWNPLQGLATLTFVLTAFFIADGILMIVLAIAHRQELTGKWEWMVANGIVDLVLAALIIAGFPGTLLWAFGLFVGIDLLFGGFTLVAMALDARKVAAA